MSINLESFTSYLIEYLFKDPQREFAENFILKDGNHSIGVETPMRRSEGIFTDYIAFSPRKVTYKGVIFIKGL